MSILQISLSIPAPPQSLSSATALSGGPISARSLCLTEKLSQLSLTIPISIPYKTTLIQMGGGPRTYPGGVSKWQWKRMQAKKAKQLLKARLARERQIYEMRKRAELKAAVSELERPWETVEKPPNLFSVSADEQLKVLADRFQKAGGLDLWSVRDGPELFRPDNGLPSARFFPKGVVHSVKPYRKAEKMDATSEEFESSGLEEDSNPGQFSGNVGKMDQRGKGYDWNSGSNQSGWNNCGSIRKLDLGGKVYDRNLRSNQSGFNNGGNVGEMDLRGKGDDRYSRSNQNGLRNGRNVSNLYPRSLEGVEKQSKNRNLNGKLRKKGSIRTYSSDSEGKNSGNARFYSREHRKSSRPDNYSTEVRRRNSYKEDQSMIPEVFDMIPQNDGSFSFEEH